MLSLGLALAAAFGYGGADYLQGMAARQAGVAPVTVLIYAAGTVAILLLLPVVHAGAFSPAAAGWGALSGAGAGAGALALAAGFRRAEFSIAGPLSAVIGAGLAVVAGLVFGERPGGLAWAGLLVAAPAILAVSASAAPAGARDRHGGRAGVWFGLAAGVGCAVSYIGLGRASATAGIWPVLAVEVSALVTVGLVAAVTGDLHVPAGGARGPCVLSGIGGAMAAICYLAAVHAGMLAIAATVTSLFPAVTVGLAYFGQGERLDRTRLAGVVLALVSVSLIALGGAA